MTATSGKYGTDELQKISADVAKAITIVYRVIHGNMFALFDLLGVVNTLRSVKLEEAKLEIGDLDEEDRREVEAAFTEGLSDIDDAALVTKLKAGADCVEKAFELVESGISVFDAAKTLFERVRVLLGV